MLQHLATKSLSISWKNTLSRAEIGLPYFAIIPNFLKKKGETNCSSLICFKKTLHTSRTIYFPGGREHKDRPKKKKKVVQSTNEEDDESLENENEEEEEIYQDINEDPKYSKQEQGIK
jgi:hypothetical protein